MRQLPILEVDGVVLCQSNSINRYLAKQFGKFSFTEQVHLSGETFTNDMYTSTSYDQTKIFDSIGASMRKLNAMA